MNTDFETFRTDIPWFINQSDKVEFSDSETAVDLSDNFRKTFPILTELIERARILTLKINDELFKLFSWTTKDNLSCGWLNKIENEYASELKLIEEHRLLLREIGGIRESYNQPQESLCNNQNFMFIESECSLGIEGWEDYYEEMCNEEGMQPIDYKNFVCFVQEANGNVTLYSTETKEVFLFAHDHCFKNVKLMENQPKYTFHTIDGINNFVGYVETLAGEWAISIK